MTAIRHLYYLKLLDWVITLEKDTKKKSVARIYFGWRNDEQATIDRGNPSLSFSSSLLSSHFSLFPLYLVINNDKITQINILREVTCLFIYIIYLHYNK